MTGGLSKEVVSEEREINTGHAFCNQQRQSYERGGLSRGWSLKRGATLCLMLPTLSAILLCSSNIMS